MTNPHEVGIKPLEWTKWPPGIEESFEGLNERRQFKERALRSIGRAVFLMFKDGKWSLDGADIDDYFDTADEAKAAAQADYEARIRSALATPPAAQGVVVRCHVQDMLKSDGTHDYFSAITVGKRSMTFFKHAIRGRAEYEVAEFEWLLNGAEKPHMIDWLERMAEAPSPPTGESRETGE